ncbi:MAG: sulfatase [Verrucomicrobiota bacterium]|nr:sulfatase [Verrucomicrobiota bacterium]
MRIKCYIGFFLLLAYWVSAAQPNIVYINADDLGVMDVGFRNAKFRTPHINRLAANGLVFNNAYAPASNCAPSRACVHSGQWGPRHGVYTVGSSYRGKAQYRKIIPVQNQKLLPSYVCTMAEALRAGGYRTIHLGKYHIGEDPLKDGFEVNVGGDFTGGPKAGGYFSPWVSGSMAPWSESVPVDTHRIDIYTQQALRFIDAHADEPMFIHFSPYLVHGPITAVPEYVSHYQDSGINAAYASMVEKLDAAIGVLMQALEEKGLADNTLVVFCSDNGGIAAVNSQAPWRAGKGSYYEGGIRQPLVMYWPKTIAPGECAELVNSLDFYPTFIDVAGLPIKENLDGVSLVPLMSGSGTWKSVPQFWHFPVYLQAYNGAKDQARDPLFRTRPGSALRMDQWKLHEYFEDGAIELYDLSNDPGEQHNLVDLLPTKAAELKRILEDWRRTVAAPVPSKLNPNYDSQAEANELAKYRLN